jgi:hypothetical protein
VNPPCQTLDGMKVRREWLAAWIFAATCASAHVDRPIRIEADGTLRGLPAKYEPAKLNWIASRPATHLTLRVGANVISLPACVASRLGLETSKLRTHASWYHTGSSLPPYIVVDVVHAESRRDGWFKGFSLLFNLDTAELIEWQRVNGSRDQTTYDDIKPQAVCSAAEVLEMEPRRAE